jgi:hypothetical protein
LLTVKKSGLRRWASWGLLAGAIVLAGASTGCTKDEKEAVAPVSAAPTESASPAASASAAPSPKTEDKNKPTMTKAEFDKLESGMTYEKVTAIVGGPGTVVVESGKKGGKDLEIHIVMYQYDGEGDFGANANLMFQDEKLMTKAQMGLK